MSSSIPDSLVEWAHLMGLGEFFSKQDLENGRTVNAALQNIV